jgi:hypothetical protein
METEIVEETWQGRMVRIHVPTEEYLYALVRIAQGKVETILSEYEWKYAE